MVSYTPSIVLHRVQRHRLLRPFEIVELTQEIMPCIETVPEMVAAMMERGWLTLFQAQELLDSDGMIAVRHYHLLNRLGAGGASNVYRARHALTGEIVALKVLHPTTLDDEPTLIRFQREMETSMRLHHPNLIRAVDAQLDAECGYLAMEYHPGIDLASVLQVERAFPVSVACAYFAQVAEGLEYIHQCGLIHRDIKPANLLMTGDGVASIEPADVASSARGHTVKILDLGLVRTHRLKPQFLTVTVDGTLLGTPDYMAPEQARHPSVLDHRADLYSLGCTFYHVLAGAVPFPGTSLMRKLYEHSMVEPVPIDQRRSDVPAEIAQLMHRLLAKDPDDRPDSAANVGQVLARHADHDPPTEG